MYVKDADDGIFLGPALQREHTSYVYPNETIPMNATVIWVPAEHKTVSLASYEKAHQTGDQDALCKISKLGIPLGCHPAGGRLHAGGCAHGKADPVGVGG